MLRGHEGKQREINELWFKHHRTSGNGLEQSATELGCCFCSVIWKIYVKLDKDVVLATNCITAHLFNVKDEQGLYRLEFKLARLSLATFLLEQTSQSISQIQLFRMLIHHPKTIRSFEATGQRKTPNLMRH